MRQKIKTLLIWLAKHLGWCILLLLILLLTGVVPAIIGRCEKTEKPKKVVYAGTFTQIHRYNEEGEFIMSVDFVEEEFYLQLSKNRIVIKDLIYGGETRLLILGVKSEENHVYYECVGTFEQAGDPLVHYITLDWEVVDGEKTVSAGKIEYPNGVVVQINKFERKWE
jgi:hypothetical protein